MSIQLKDVKAQCQLPFTVELRGKVSYSHITRKIEGEELAKENARRAQKGIAPTDTPYYAFNIQNPEILNSDTNPVPPIVVQYLNEKIKSRIDPNTQVSSRTYFGTSKSKFAPSVAYSVLAGQNLAGVGIADNNAPLEKELANGLDVTIGLRFYAVSKGIGAGVNVDYVLVNEPVRFYEGNNSIVTALQNQGVVYQAPAPTEQAQAQPQTAQHTDDAVQPQTASPMGQQPQNVQAQQSNMPFNANANMMNNQQAATPFGNQMGQQAQGQVQNQQQFAQGQAATPFMNEPVSNQNAGAPMYQAQGATMSYDPN